MIFVKGNENISLEVKQGGQDHSFNFKGPFRDGKVGLKKEPFEFKISVNGEDYSGLGVFGYDALWLPYGNGYGLKIIRTNKNADKMVKNVEYIQKINSDVFPAIKWVSIYTIGDVECVVCEMQEIEEEPMNFDKPHFMSGEDYDFYMEYASVPVQVIKKCVDNFIEHELFPETSWYKNGGFGAKNIISGKIVDFHLFEHKPDMFKMPTDLSDHEVCNEIYSQALERYKKWIPIDGVPKWKGKIYQGMNFSNGFGMPGYSSDDLNYDSYVKGTFLPLDKVSGKNVLDLGSNQGFFDFQCALAGAKTTGVEITNEDVMLANDIREKILKLDNCEFINGDAIKYLEETEEWYELIIMSSVLHQTHPDLYSSDDFLDELASKCKYFFFETPVRHKHYNFSLKEIDEKLNEHFATVRMVYFYDCYSTGYRAVFVCYPWDPNSNKPGLYREVKSQGRVKPRN